jgi:hypothetical protein
MPLWFGLLIYISHQYIEWSVCGVVMTLIVCSFVFILLNNLESRNNHTYYVEVKFV